MLGVMLVLVACPVAPASSMHVWVATDCQKVKRDTPVGGACHIWSPGDNTVRLKGARNEYLAFQVIVRADSALSGVNVSRGGLSGPGGTIGASNVTLFREKYLQVTEPSTAMYGDPSSDGTGWYPDPLVPLDAPTWGAPFDIPAGRNGGIWVDVFVPKGTAAGTYRGNLTVTASGQPATTIGLEVTVWDFTIPDEQHMKTWFYFGQDEMANGHHVAKYDDHYKELERKYYSMARTHRFNIDAPVYFEYSGTGAGVTVDFDSYHDELAGPLYDGTIYPDGRGMDPICLPIGQGFPYPDDHGGLYSDEFAETLKQMLRLVKQHFDERGWTSRAFLWIIDEPNDADAYDRVRRYGQIINDSGTGIPFMITEQPEPQDPSWGSLEGYVDIWCPGAGAYDPARMASLRAAGDRTWTYNGGRPYAGSQLIDTGGEAMRTWGWLAYKYGVQCWLYWHCMYWKDIYNDPGADNDVWNDPLTFDQRRGGGPWPDWGNGDGTLFYPGYDVGVDGPVSSQRMKVLRRGLTDYEYMWLLASQGKAAVAASAIDSVIDYGLGDAEGRPVGWSTDPDAWEVAREAMGSQISPTDWPVRSTWYLAEGTTREGFEEWITISNPGGGTANVNVRYLLSTGETRDQPFAVGPSSRYTVDVNSFLGPEQDASAIVTSDADIVVERPMYFNYHGAWDGGHDVVGHH
ncbi:MAG: glycoside hydrolase domain-containing protein [Actinomycetota bacterium]